MVNEFLKRYGVSVGLSQDHEKMSVRYGGKIYKLRHEVDGNDGSYLSVSTNDHDLRISHVPPGSKVYASRRTHHLEYSHYEVKGRQWSALPRPDYSLHAAHAGHGLRLERTADDTN